MNVYTAISLGIAIAGFIAGIIAKIAGLSMNYGKLAEKVDINEKRDNEEREKAGVKFSELYNRMSANESNIKETRANVDSLTATCQRIEAKLDRIIEREMSK